MRRIDSARRAAAVGALLLLVGCLDATRPEDDASAPMRLQLAATLAGSLAAATGIAVDVGYARRDESVVPLASERVPYDGGEATLTLSVDVGGCLADPQRADGTDGCPLVVRVTLFDQAGVAAEQAVGPVAGMPGRTSTLPEFRLQARRVACVELSSPALTVWRGRAAPLTARAFAPDGSEVPDATFVWTSSAEETATVADGSVRGAAAGIATVRTQVAGEQAAASAAVTVVEGPLLTWTVPSAVTGQVQRVGETGLALRCELTAAARLASPVPLRLERASFTFLDANTGAAIATNPDDPRTVFGRATLAPQAAPYEVNQWYALADQVAVPKYDVEYAMEYSAEGDPTGHVETATYRVRCIEPPSDVTVIASIPAPRIVGTVRGTYLTCGTPFSLSATGAGYATWGRSRFRVVPLEGPAGEQLDEGLAAEWLGRPTMVAGETVGNGASSQWASPDGERVVPRSHRVEVTFWYTSGGVERSTSFTYDCVRPA